MRWFRTGSGVAALRVRGIHVHVGSDLRDVGAWAEAGVRPCGCSRRISAGRRPSTPSTSAAASRPVARGAPLAGQFHAALQPALETAGLTCRRACGRARTVPGRSRRLAGQPRAALPATPAPGPADRARRRDDRAGPAGPLRQPPRDPARPRSRRPTQRQHRCGDRRSRARSASSPTPSASTSCRSSNGRPRGHRGGGGVRRRRSPRATTAGRSPTRCCAARRLPPALSTGAPSRHRDMPHRPRVDPPRPCARPA